MIARTEYTQLGYSPLRLVGCVLGLGVTFPAPPLATEPGWRAVLGGGAWLVMMLLYRPMIPFYAASPIMAPALPPRASIYP